MALNTIAVAKCAGCAQAACQENVPTDTVTYDIPEHFCLIPERVVLVPE